MWSCIIIYQNELRINETLEKNSWECISSTSISSALQLLTKSLLENVEISGPFNPMPPINALISKLNCFGYVSKIGTLFYKHKFESLMCTRSILNALYYI